MGQRYMIWLILCLLWKNCLCWQWFFSPGYRSAQVPEENKALPNAFFADFSMEVPNHEKVENAKKKLSLPGTNSCWIKAYQNLFSGCAETINDNQKRQWLAWHLSDCFQRDSGGRLFPPCSSPSSIKGCLETLDEDSRLTYLTFFLETNSICHELQAFAFRQQTERLVNDLKKSSQSAKEKLENIVVRAEDLLHGSKEVQGSLTMINFQTQQVVEASKYVDDRIKVVLGHSKDLFEQSKGLASSQLELQEGQEKTREKLEEGLAVVNESYNSLGQELDLLRNGAVEIEKEIGRIGNSMSSKLEDLQGKADRIGDMAGVSMEKQKELLHGQSTALDGIQFLTQFQSQALQESRDALQQLADFRHKQQEKLVARQEELQLGHDHLIQNSKSILEAQEAFESKQANMFTALEKLFTLHNAMLVESRLMRAFFVYSILIFVLYIFTSTKQTYTVRPRLYVGLSMTFFVEVMIFRFDGQDVERKTWIVNLARSIFVLVASLQLVHAIFTYRDYEVLNHAMLLSLSDKVNDMQKNQEDSLYESDIDVDWPSWIESELTEDADELNDPDFELPEPVVLENVMPTSVITRTYNLRGR